jgi:hypothetical protein
MVTQHQSTHASSVRELSGFGHLILQMAPDAPAFRAYNLKSSGVRPRGRPCRRWIEGVAETLNNHGLTVAEASSTAFSTSPRHPKVPQEDEGSEYMYKLPDEQLENVDCR